MTAAPPATSPSSLSSDLGTSASSVRAERDLYRDRLRRVAEAIGCEDETKVVHDVRNVMNELVLLRKLVELDEE